MPWPTPDQIHQMHVVDKLSTSIIAARFGMCRQTLRKLMKAAGIKALGNQHLRAGKPATWNIGLKRSSDTRAKISAAKMGSVPFNKGSGDQRFACENCSAEVIDKPYRRHRTCSKKCRNQLMSKLRGEKHWNYTGRDSSNQRQRLWAECREWRLAVLARDGGECTVCGSRNRLTAHHLDSWHGHPDLRFYISNGVTLCHDHHWDFHRATFHRHATRAMFERWLEGKA